MYSLRSQGFEILDEGSRSVRVGGVTRYGNRITGISVISDVPGCAYETLTLGPGENGKLTIVYTDDPPYYGDVMRFDTFSELVRHLRYATGRRTTTVVEDESSVEEESSVEDESSVEEESSVEDEVEIAETGKSAAAPPPPPEVVVETAETGETAAAPPPPPADTGTPVPPIPPEMGIMELGAQLVELFQDKGPMMTESETKALGALMELMKTLGA